MCKIHVVYFLFCIVYEIKLVARMFSHKYKL